MVLIIMANYYSNYMVSWIILFKSRMQKFEAINTYSFLHIFKNITLLNSQKLQLSTRQDDLWGGD
jgi:hypothetical protein